MARGRQDFTSPGERRSVPQAAAAVVFLLVLAFGATLWVTQAAAQSTSFIRIETAPGGLMPLLGARTFTSGDTLRVFAAGYAADSLYNGPLDVTWSAEPALLGLEPAGGSSTLLRAQVAGTCRVVARDSLGIEAWSDTLRILPGPPARLAAFATSPTESTPELASLVVGADSTLVVYAGAYDAGGNWLGPHEVDWSVSAPLGSVLPTHAALTVFAAGTTGSGVLRLEKDALPIVQIPLRVLPGRLVTLRILLSPGGPVLADTTLVAGSTLPLFAAGFDAKGNRIEPAPIVDWSATGPAVVAAPSPDSAATLQAVLPGSARVVIRSGSFTATSGTVHVVAGTLARVRLSLAADSYVPVGATTLDADGGLELFALGEDAAGHALGPVSVDWTSTDPAVAHPTSTSGASVLVEAQRVGVAQVVASPADASPDTSGALTVLPGRTAQLRIETRADGTGTEIDALTLSADSSLSLVAVGRDADGNFTETRQADWTVSGGIGTMSASSGAAVQFEPRLPGAGQITATDFLHIDVTGTITVVAGAPHRLRIEDAGGIALASRLLVPGESLIAQARVTDTDGNPLGLEPATWSWIGSALASVPAEPVASYSWAATNAGRGRLVAQAATVLPDTSGEITVTNGSVSRLEIWDAADSPLATAQLSADSTLFVHAVAFDAGGNPLGDVPVDWSIDSAGGTAELQPARGSSALLHPHQAGLLAIVARHASGVSGRSDTLAVVPGRLASVGIETAAGGAGEPVGARMLTASDTLVLHAVGRDAQANLLGAIEVSWLLEGDIGSLVPSFGDSVRLYANRIGVGRIRAIHVLGPGGMTGDLTVTAGPPASLVLQRGPGLAGAPLGSLSLACDDSLLVVALALDALGNPIAAEAAGWQLLDDPAAALLQPAGPAGQISLLPLHPATVRLQASWNGLVAISPPLTFSAGRMAQLAIETNADGSGARAGDRALLAGERLALHAVARDTRGNFVSPVPVRWLLGGNAGSLDSEVGASTIFTALRPGDAIASASHATLPAAVTGTLRVAPGPPTVLAIERTPGDPADSLGDVWMAAGDSLLAFAVQRDSLGNLVGAASSQWSLSGDSLAVQLAAVPGATFGSAIRLHAQRPGTVRLQAQSGALAAASGEVHVALGSPARLGLETAAEGGGSDVGARTLAAGERLVLHAIVRDRMGNFIAASPVQWHLTGGIGRLDPEFGEFTQLIAERPGTGAITAIHPTLPASATGELVVLAGVPAFLVLEHSAGDPSDPLGDALLAAGDSLHLAAVLRDSLGNCVGAAQATWQLLGDAGIAAWDAPVPPAAAAETRLWALHPGVLRVRSSWGGLDATSGALTIVPGPMRRLSVESAADGSGMPVGSTSLAAGSVQPLHAIARDEEANFVAAVSVQWSLSGNAGQLDGTLGPATRFLAERPGSARVTAAHTTLGSAMSGDIGVVPGATTRIVIEQTAGDPADPVTGASLAAGDSLVAYAVQRDSLGNWAGDAAAMWSLAGDTTSAALAGAAPSERAVLRALKPGSVRLVADWNGFTATSGPAEVRPGAVTGYALETAADGSGIPIGTRTLLAGESLTLHAVGRDRLGNPVGPVEAAWTLLGDIGRLDSASGPLTTLLVERAGSGQVVATHPTFGARTSGALTVLAGTPARLAIERTPGDPADPIGASTLSADDSLLAYAVLRDSLGNFVGAAPALWSVSGDSAAAALADGAGPGEVDHVWLQVLHPGNVRLTARWNALAGASGDLVLQSGAPFGTFPIAIEPDSLRATASESAQVQLGPVRDRRGNPVLDGTRLDVRATLGDWRATSDLDPARADLQLATLNGLAAAMLSGTESAGNALVQATAGAAQGEAPVHFLPPLVVAAVPGSLQPSIVQRGAEATLRVQCVNHDLLPLRLAAATLWIEDGNGTRCEAELESAENIAPASAAELHFAPVVVPALLHTGSYAAQLRLQGSDGLGRSFQRTLGLGPSSLTVLGGAGLRVTSRSPGIVTRGASVRFELTVLNAGDTGVDLDPARSELRDARRVFVSALDSTSTLRVPAGGEATLRFLAAIWPDSLPQGEVPLVAALSGSQSSGAYAEEITLAPVTARDPARLAPVAPALAPTFAPAGSAPSLTVRVRNTGGSELALDLATQLWVAEQAAPLAGPVIVDAGSIATLHFAAMDLGDLAPGLYPVRLTARGTQSGYPFAEELGLADSLLVFEPAALTIVGVQPSQPTVTRGQTEPWDLAVLLYNAGQSAFRVEAADIHVVLGGVDRTGSYTLVRTKPLGSPVAPASTDTLRFRVLRTGEDTGAATLEADVRAVDVVSGAVLAVNTYQGGKGSVRVQQPALPVAEAMRLAQATASAGQSRPIEALVRLRNDGEAALALDVDALAANFTTTPPVTVVASLADGAPLLGAGEALTVRYVLGPMPAAPCTLHLHATLPPVELNRQLAMPVHAAESLPVRAPAALAISALAAPSRVTRAQPAPWSVRVTVTNTGESEAALDSLRLLLERAGTDASAAFAVQQPGAFTGRSGLRLGGGEPGGLDFTISSTDTLPGDVQIGFAASALELDSGRRVAVSGTGLASVRIEREPRLVLLESTLRPRTASHGQRIDLQVAVSNEGEATLVLDPAASAVRLPGTSAVAALGSPVTLAGGGTDTLRFEPLLVDVGPGEFPLEFVLAGVENGNPHRTTLASAFPMQVDAAVQLEILAVRASREIVTSGQERPWQVRVAVQNGGAPATFLAASLTQSLGPNDVSAGFAIRAPETFLSGRTTLANGAVDTLQFEIERTAPVEGLVVLDAAVQVRDGNSGEVQNATSSGAARGSVQVASAASPLIAALECSQLRLSAGQHGMWTVRMTVRNAGGTAWRPTWPSAALLVGTSADDSIATPAGFDAGPEVLQPGATATATFRVLRTGAETGPLALHAALAGTQETDGRSVAALDPPATYVLGERGARLQIDSLLTGLPRGSHLNTGQLVPCIVQVSNTGDAGLRTAALRVELDGAGAPADTLMTFELGGGGRSTLRPTLRAGGVPGTLTLRARLEAAVDANDSTRTTAWEESTLAIDLTAESPGVLAGSLAVSQERVSAGQASPWWVELHCRNSGEEPLRLSPPRADELAFYRGTAPQSDYLVVPPDSLLEGGLVLAGGGAGTLRYRIARTGSAGGEVELRARLRATHANDDEAVAAEMSAAGVVWVDAEPGVRVFATESITWRRLHGHDDYRVNSGQSFVLRVVVENTGGTYIDSVRVQIDSQRGNSTVGANPFLAALAPGERGELDLPAVAGSWESDPGLPEIFTAHVVAARDRNTGLSVLPGAAVDNTSFAYVEAPALLGLHAFVESPEGATDGVLTAGQEFVLAARIDNSGEAALSASGRLGLALPASFALLQGESEIFFTPGSVVRWTLQAPLAAAASAETLQVRIAAVPADQNDGDPARVQRGLAALPLEVRAAAQLTAQLEIGAPAGAEDHRLSCGQRFELEAAALANSELDSRQAELLLPAGWVLPAGQLAKRDLADEPVARTGWSLVAPAEPGDYRLHVRMTARDPNDESQLVATDTLALQVERGASLSLAAAIVAPAEAADGRLLPGTVFRLRALVRNQGQAAVQPATGESADGSLRLADLPAGYVVESRVRDFSLGPAGTASAEWLVTAPSAYRPAAETLRLVFERLPEDANSGTAAAVDPDSSTARCVVALTAEGLEITTEAVAHMLAAPGQLRVPLLSVQFTNGCEHPVRLDSLGALPLVDGGAATRWPFSRLYAEREGAIADVLEVRPLEAGPAWFTLGSAPSATLEAGAASRWTLYADIAPDAPARRLGLVLREAASEQALVRASEGESRTPVPVRAAPGETLGGDALRVVAADVAAYNAPNPFHAERERTTIHYQVDSAAAVMVRIRTLQGALVWESSRHEDASGPSLRGVEWDGRNGAGQWVRNGVYVCEVQVGSRTNRFKIAVVR